MSLWGWGVGDRTRRPSNLSTFLVNFSLCFNVEQDEMLPSNSHQKLFEVEVLEQYVRPFSI